jgi:hypothetical protein
MRSGQTNWTSGPANNWGWELVGLELGSSGPMGRCLDNENAMMEPVSQGGPYPPQPARRVGKPKSTLKMPEA